MVGRRRLVGRREGERCVVSGPVRVVSSPAARPRGRAAGSPARLRRTLGSVPTAAWLAAPDLRRRISTALPRSSRPCLRAGARRTIGPGGARRAARVDRTPPRPDGDPDLPAGGGRPAHARAVRRRRLRRTRSSGSGSLPRRGQRWRRSPHWSRITPRRRRRRWMRRLARRASARELNAHQEPVMTDQSLELPASEPGTDEEGQADPASTATRSSSSPRPRWRRSHRTRRPGRSRSRRRTARSSTTWFGIPRRRRPARRP